MEQDFEIETPQKKRCLEKSTPEKSRESQRPPSALFRAQEALPTFGGLLAELLFVEEKGGMRDLHSLLCSSKTAELKLLVGIKEMRIQHERDASQVRSYAEMCDQVQERGVFSAKRALSTGEQLVSSRIANCGRGGPQSSHRHSEPFRSPQ
mmetsp:Transcript_44576/g.92135  ORF Transcript_44576/g.92135 Transcript_44576/m.92135 type:complete len:151 (+) Transcript_44576:89-541(+)